MEKAVQKNRKYILWIVLAVCIAVCGLWFCKQNAAPPIYSNADFGIEVYISDTDYDHDGVDDQTDILNSALSYIATKPKYKSKYYAGGYPNDGCGVCTDVVAFALKGAGYDLMQLVQADILLHKAEYNIEAEDKNIDFRRVSNLAVYFKNNLVSLTTDTAEIAAWQGGDIVIFENHIGIVSSKRNQNGVPLVIHHNNPFQRSYEEDILKKRTDIIGHYRMH